MLAQSITKNSLILGLFALVTAGSLAAIYAGTSARIAEQEKRAAEKALLEIIPRARHDNDMLTSLWPMPQAVIDSLHLSGANKVFIAAKNNRPIAVIMPSTAPDGYSGDIKLLVGINMDGSVAGVRVLSHKETPGLGDKVSLSKSNWLLSFNNKSLRNPLASLWTVKKDGGEFDQFTGATITPRAVTHQVKKTLEMFNAHRQNIVDDYTKQMQSTSQQAATP